MTYADKCCAIALIRAIVERGLTYRIVDSEACIFEDDEPTTYHDFTGAKELGQMDDECIIVDDDAAFQFIWNNGSEWDPIVAISDYSACELGNRLYQDTEDNLHTGSLNGLQIIGSTL
jgi:hypothetical protein